MKSFQEYLAEAKTTDPTYKESEIDSLIKKALSGESVELGGDWSLSPTDNLKGVYLMLNNSQSIDDTNPQRVKKALEGIIKLKEIKNKVSKLKNKPIDARASIVFIVAKASLHISYDYNYDTFYLTNKRGMPVSDDAKSVDEIIKLYEEY